MIRGNDRLERALGGSHTPKVRAEAWLGNRRLGVVEVGDGDVRQDAGQFQRRSGRVEIRPTRDAREWLSMPGTALRVWRGVDGVAADIPVLWGPVRAPRATLGAASISADVEDLSRRVIRDGFPSPRQSMRGATVAQQILLLWRESVPWCGWSDDTMDSTAVPSLTWDSDRAAAIGDLAASIGCETWMRPDGTVMLRRVSSEITGVTHRVLERVNLAAHADIADWDSTVNHVAIRSDSTDNPVTGEYADWDSPTGITACGRHTKRISTATVTTSAQARVAAKAYVLRSQGSRVSAEYEAVVHPGVEPGDVHLVRSALSARRYVVDSVEFGLRSAGMTLTGRIPSIADGLED